MKITGPLSYHAELQSGETVRKHIDAIRKREIRYPPANVDTSSSTEDDVYLPSPVASPPTGGSPPPPPPGPVRRSTRRRAPPDYFSSKT